ncbi:MAG TPA: PP0621 family protein [Alicycliphilus sp.]|nr:PP0621 family protein [Alicycliphilus sp.]
MKYLIVLAVIAVVYALWRSQRAAPPSQRPATRPRPAAPQEMVRCAHCGVHLPRGEALEHGGHSYCCRAHQDLGPN